MGEPSTADRVKAQRVCPRWCFFGTADSSTADCLSIQEPLQRRKRIVRSNAMSIRSSTYRDSKFFRCVHRRNAARGLRAILLQELVASEVHRILHGPAHTKRFHPSQTLFGCIVEVCD